MKYIQGSKRWLEMRKNHIGASDISCIVETNPWKSAYTLWLEKTGRKEADKVNEAMQYGIDHEDDARQLYIQEKGILVLADVIFDNKWDIAMASLDGITADKKIIQEFKCPLKPKLYNEALKDKIPPYYMDQIQWQLMISKADRCDYCVWIDNFNMKIIEVFPDINRQAYLLKEAKIFWQLVTNDIPPPMSEGDVEYVIDKEHNEIANKIRECKEVEAKAKAERTALEEKLKELYPSGKCYFHKAKIDMNWIDKKGLIDWKAVQKNWFIDDDELEEYRKNGTTYCKFSLKD